MALQFRSGCLQLALQRLYPTASAAHLAPTSAAGYPGGRSTRDKACQQQQQNEQIEGKVDQKRQRPQPKRYGRAIRDGEGDQKRRGDYDHREIDRPQSTDSGGDTPDYSWRALWFKRSRSCLPVLKNGMCFSATLTLSPVRGLRPTRASRRLTENAPNPRNSTRSPRASAAAISSKIAVTMTSTSRWYKRGLASASFCTSSDFVIVPRPCSDGRCASVPNPPAGVKRWTRIRNLTSSRRK